MKTSHLLIGILLISLISLMSSVGLVSAAEISSYNQDIKVYYFYSPGCSHCAKVSASGILENIEALNNVELIKYSVIDDKGREEFFKYANLFNLAGDGQTRVPIIFIESDGKYSYLVGDDFIINSLEDSVINFEGIELDIDDYQWQEENLKKLTLWAVIIAALIDSVNPCAFGVLIFLMASLLRLGSARRALKAGLIYSFVIFLVYFFVGVILYQVIDSLSSSVGFYYFYIAIAVMILVLGLIQLKDVFWDGRGISLKIPSKVKPFLKSLMSKGTLFAIIVLGIAVALFELPCTGEVYLGILTIMSINKTFGLGYLILYNLIFILPLVILTFIIYKGTSTEKLQKWTSSNKRWMKLASGLILIALATYIFIMSMKFL